MNAFQISTHAAKRMKQRAISEVELNYLINFGECIHDKHGCEIYFLSKRAIKEVVSEQGPQLRTSLHKLFKSYAVISETCIITAGIRTKRINRS